MSRLDLLTDEDLATARASEPSKRWVNWWLGTGGPHAAYGQTTPGVPYSNKITWPSRDVAESRATEWLARNRYYALRGGKYLGAFPAEHQLPNT